MEELVKTLQETVNKLSTQVVELTCENEKLKEMNKCLKDRIDKLQEDSIKCDSPFRDNFPRYRECMKELNESFKNLMKDV